jgi:ATP-dependent NAD(P)H-hydrate dehydratase
MVFAQPKSRLTNIIQDGLWAVSEDPSIIHGYESAILTPNVAEYSRLCKKVLGAEPDAQDDDPSASVKKLAAALGNVTILKKGAVDIISNGQNGTLLKWSERFIPSQA